MPAATTGSTVPRRQLGRYLRDLRGQARLTVRAAARALEWSEPKLWRIETGQTSLRSLDAKAMCEIYGADAEMTEILMGLAKETKSRGWWHAYGDVVPDTFDLYIGLEEAADRIDWYEPELVPGLLQTEDYARAVMRTHNPAATPEEIDKRVTLRKARQMLLTRVVAAPTLRIAINEAVLRRPVGGNRLMAEQVARIGEASELPNVALRVVRFSAGMHMGALTGQFTILRFPGNGEGKETEPPTVYADGFTGDLYLDKPAEVERYAGAFSDIWTASLDEQASRRLISDVAGSYERG
ncbi:helix-turn-helix domain-containing protein [Streptomyces sp. NRRL F-2890]|uniref:helix-turn-helix domain-containing protein n=1 Tax=Streptomyces sp. NRRL F-2890 TaxID=1463845 RepID=UPI0004C54C76|nr:helix-turn-helix transcriptional regulator [Streptomyces sp. NRRL F-2890]